MHPCLPRATRFIIVTEAQHTISGTTTATINRKSQKTTDDRRRSISFSRKTSPSSSPQPLKAARRGKTHLRNQKEAERRHMSRFQHRTLPARLRRKFRIFCFVISISFSALSPENNTHQLAHPRLGSERKLSATFATFGIIGWPGRPSPPLLPH